LTRRVQNCFYPFVAQGWQEIFGDTVMTAAIIDRLTHKSYLLNMNDNSYRLKKTREWLAKQEEEKDGLN